MIYSRVGLAVLAIGIVAATPIDPFCDNLIQFSAGSYSYANAVQACAARNQVLASLADYCPNGPETTPLCGQEPTDTWVPVSDGPDNWAQVGTRQPGDLCREHVDAVGQGPTWGADSTTVHSFRKYFACVDAAPLCALPASEWLETEFMPELLVTPTGFNTGVKDMFRMVFTYHRKYFDVVPSSGALTIAGGELALTSTVEHSPTDCYDTYTVDVAWANLVDECFRAEEGGASGFVTFTCKLEVDAKETLSPIRSTNLVREVHNELPFVVKFPKQVSASVSNLSAFQPPNVLAAVIRQEVQLDVSAVTDIDAKITLFTSTQWPFYLDTATMKTNSIPALITEDSFVNSVHCPDLGVADAPNPTVDDALACSQQWVLDLQVNAAELCEIDGAYQVEFNARCQPTFLGQTDCPLVQDDLGQIDNVFKVDFTIDSENFCAQVVDSVDVAATLASFKDHAHTVAATNYIQGQTAYFVTKVSSTKVTVVSVEVDDIDFEITGGPSAGQYSLFVDGANAAGALPTTLALVVEDSVATGVQDEAYFQFLVEGSIFDVPADGSSDFEVTIVLNVGFKDATGLVVLEQQQVRLLQSKSQQLATSATSGVTQGDDTTAGAGAVAFTSAAALASVGAILA